ncbi:MAG TPA: acyltransferase family protein [Anaerolineae bacterium]|nr:acyltransferase family protein [Anaerolineae bacterium]
MTAKQRLYFFDNLRVVAMCLVIAHHAAQPYGPTGGTWPIKEAQTAAVLGPFFMVNRSFGMSLFFLIAGYFAAASCDRSGPRTFLRGRLLRLGLPLLAVIAVMMLLQVFVFGAQDGALGSPWPVEVGHMWFVEHLLIMSLAYGLWCLARLRHHPVQREPAAVPPWWAIVAFAIILAVVTGLVRIWFPIDEWRNILGFLKVAWGDVPRDLSFFVLGLLAYRQQWVSRFPARTGFAWLGVGLFLAALWYAYDLWLRQSLGLGDTFADVLTLLWEALLCCGLCIGLTVLFRERANVQTRLLRWLANAQYAAYVVHLFVVLAFQALLSGVEAPPLAKFALVTLASAPLSFLLAGLIRKPLRL